jgi:hypothetical protein
MSKPRSPSTQRECAFRKNEREQVKRDKAALKRQRRERNKCATRPLTPDAAGGTEADAQRLDDQRECFLRPEDSESEGGAHVGTERCTG